MLLIFCLCSLTQAHALQGLWQPSKISSKSQSEGMRKLEDGLLISRIGEVLIQKAIWTVVVTLDVPCLPDALGHHLKLTEDALNQIGSYFTP